MHTQKAKPYGFWNWGTGIAIAMIMGASGLAYLGYKSHQVRFDLVEKDYYTAEIQYDQKKSAQANAHQLAGGIDIQQATEHLLIGFPKECVGTNIQGNILLYRPSGQNMDIEIPIILDKDGFVIISDKNLSAGKYILKADWTMNDKLYNIEKPFFVKK